MCVCMRVIFMKLSRVCSAGLGSAPVGRSWHTLTAVSDSSLFLFGGLSVDCRPMSMTHAKLHFPLEHGLNTKPQSFLSPQVTGGYWIWRQKDGGRWSIKTRTNRGRCKHAEVEINRIRHQAKNKCTSIMYLTCSNSVPDILKYIL